MLKTKIVAQLIPFATLGIIIIVIFLLANVMFDGDDSNSNNVYNEVKTEITTELETEPITLITDDKITETPETLSNALTENIQEVPHREGIYGISNKNINDIDDSFSASDVRNDVTGNWRISTIASNINIVEYALSYYKEKFKNNNEIHGIINLNNNTTTKITVMGEMLDISVYEYTSGEEHDANLLYGGMLLKQYVIYLDNGDIEEIQ